MGVENTINENDFGEPVKDRRISAMREYFEDILDSNREMTEKVRLLLHLKETIRFEISYDLQRCLQKQILEAGSYDGTQKINFPGYDELSESTQQFVNDFSQPIFLHEPTNKRLEAQKLIEDIEFSIFSIINNQKTEEDRPEDNKKTKNDRQKKIIRSKYKKKQMVLLIQLLQQQEILPKSNIDSSYFISDLTGQSPIKLSQELSLTPFSYDETDPDDTENIEKDLKAMLNSLAKLKKPKE